MEATISCLGLKNLRAVQAKHGSFYSIEDHARHSYRDSLDHSLLQIPKPCGSVHVLFIPASQFPAKSQTSLPRSPK